MLLLVIRLLNDAWINCSPSIFLFIGSLCVLATYYLYNHSSREVPQLCLGIGNDNKLIIQLPDGLIFTE